MFKNYLFLLYSIVFTSVVCWQTANAQIIPFSFMKEESTVEAFTDSFESWSSGTNQAPDDWTKNMHWNTGNCGQSTTNVSNGSFALKLWIGDINFPAAWCQVSRDFDLTSYNSMIIDVTSVSGTGLAIKINGATLASAITAQNNLTFDISGYSGVNTVSFEYNSEPMGSITILDNFRLTP